MSGMEFRNRKICAFAIAICFLLVGCGQMNGADVPGHSSETTEIQESTIMESGSDSTADQKEKVDDENILSVGDFEKVGIENSVEVTDYPVFDFDKKVVTLNSGYEMPILGIGTYALS
ncbi:MAG: hypothetical protein K6E34_01435, partial [Lachnospiraceae bacterium]|nr:hypothetical protein [Lachnospiraceae bacterium]